MHGALHFARYLPFALSIGTMAFASLALLDPAGAEAGASLLVRAASKCIGIGQKRICLDDEDPANNAGDGDDDDEKPKKKKNKGKKTGNICAGKDVSCPAGYVVLDKPNKYGACCEPKEGLPKSEAEKCKFPGEVGTPPNCHCPENTEFVGYKGCVTIGFRCVVKYWEVGPAQDLTYDYTGIGDEIKVRGELSKEMDLRKYHAKGPVTCTKVYYK